MKNHENSLFKIKNIILSVSLHEIYFTINNFFLFNQVFNFNKYSRTYDSRLNKRQVYFIKDNKFIALQSCNAIKTIFLK